MKKYCILCLKKITRCYPCWNNLESDICVYNSPQCQECIEILDDNPRIEKLAHKILNQVQYK